MPAVQPLPLSSWAVLGGSLLLLAAPTLLFHQRTFSALPPLPSPTRTSESLLPIPYFYFSSQLYCSQKVTKFAGNSPILSLLEIYFEKPCRVCRSAFHFDFTCTNWRVMFSWSKSSFSLLFCIVCSLIRIHDCTEILLHCTLKKNRNTCVEGDI